MPKISACIIAYNEAAKIEAAVASVLWADEVLVVDSNSTDGTAALAEALGARVVQVPFTGFGELRNRAIEACRHEWIFSLDADERCTAASRDEIAKAVASSAAHDAYLVPRRSYMMGRWITGSGWYPNYRQPQLFRKGALRYTHDPVHEGYEVLIETGGYVSTESVDPRASIILDVKCPASGEEPRNHWPNLDRLRADKDEVKFVVADRADWEYARDCISRYDLERRARAVLISPVWDSVDLKELAEWIASSGMPFFPGFTDHGPDHLSRVLATASWLIADDAWSVLTARDAACLVLAVLLHDAAMHLTEDSFRALIAYSTPQPAIRSAAAGPG